MLVMIVAFESKPKFTRAKVILEHLGQFFSKDLAVVSGRLPLVLLLMLDDTYLCRRWNTLSIRSLDFLSLFHVIVRRLLFSLILLFFILFFSEEIKMTQRLLISL